MRHLLTIIALAAGVPANGAEDRFANVEVISQHVAGSIYVLHGAGGNIGISVGADGTFMIDDEFRPLSERVLAAVEALGGERPKLLLNTHMHADHVGGNAFFGDAVIFAHENVRVRLLGEGLARPALPVLTYEDRLRLYFNDDQIDVFHVPAGHTDGDSIVWFRGADVVHMGDQFWNRLFPRIDTAAGGSVDGYLANIDRVLGMIGPDTRVIPGHGMLGGRADLALAAEMIRESRALVAQAVAEDQLDELIATGLGERWEPWGEGFVTEEAWIRTLADAETQ